jgi:hypothetical protein
MTESLDFRARPHIKDRPQRLPRSFAGTAARSVHARGSRLPGERVALAA